MLLIYLTPSVVSDLGGFSAGLLGDEVELTTDPARYADAHAAVVNLRGLDPARLGDKPPGMIWVAWSMESAVNYPVLDDPAVMAKFDLQATYRCASDVWAPYLPDASAFTALARSNPPVKSEPSPAVVFQSSDFNKSQRLQYLVQLMAMMPIDSFGRVLRNRTITAPDAGRATKLEIIARYKFCLAFENSIDKDYVTEKLYDPLLAGTVPVYLGAPNVGEFAPGPGSFIDVRDHASPSALAAYLIHLVNTPAEYQTYFAWRTRPLPAAMLSKWALLQKPVEQRIAEAVQRRRAA